MTQIPQIDSVDSNWLNLTQSTQMSQLTPFNSIHSNDLNDSIYSIDSHDDHERFYFTLTWTGVSASSGDTPKRVIISVQINAEAWANLQFVTILIRKTQSNFIETDNFYLNIRINLYWNCPVSIFTTIFSPKSIIFVWKYVSIWVQERINNPVHIVSPTLVHG